LGRILLEHLYRRGLFRTWLRDKPEGWELVSGVWSPFYIQARYVPSYPELLRFVGQALAEVIRNEVGPCDSVVGLATAGIPLATAAALELGVSMCYTRKLNGVRTIEDLTSRARDYGDHAMLEGTLASGNRVVLVDDVSAQFTSKQIAHWQITTEVRNRRLHSVSIPAVAVLVDREQGSAATAASSQLGLDIVSVVRLKSEGLHYLRDILLPREHEIVSSYVEDPYAFQDLRLRKELIAEAQSFRKSLVR